MSVIVGIDEVGRGCWAGPLLAAAVVLAGPIDGLKDSKLLSATQRQRLDVIIRSKAPAIGLGWVGPGVVDELGLTKATALAMQQALQAITVPFTKIIIDGNLCFIEDERAQASIGADKTVPAVSAASIIAKVARDTYMQEQAKNFPEYGFDRHVGYGTAAHRLALEQYGPCELHRRSYKPVQALQSATMSV